MYTCCATPFSVGSYEDICLREVTPFKEKRLLKRHGECIRKAVAIIKACRMLSFAKPSVGRTRQIHMAGRNGKTVYTKSIRKHINLSLASVAVPGIHYDGCFNERSRRDASYRSIYEGGEKAVSFRLVLQDGDNGGRVNNHLAQPGSPRASYPRSSSSFAVSRRGSRAMRACIRATSSRILAVVRRPASRLSRSRRAFNTASVKVSPVTSANCLARRSASSFFMLNAILKKDTRFIEMWTVSTISGKA